jgi:putative DNA primase/helicase
MQDVIDRTETAKEAARRLSGPMLRKGFKPTGLHEYTSASGEPLYWRIRAEHPTEAKWIRPMMQDEAGAYVLGEPPAPGVGKPLYRLHVLASRPDAVVIVTEGEGKADMLERIGCTVTTSGSASSADGADWSPLQGRRVLIWPDRDDAGAKYAQAVAAKLQGIAAEVHIIDVATLNLPLKGDAVEWLEAHPSATADNVLALPIIGPDVADQWPQPQPLVADVQPDDYPLDALPGQILAAVQEVHEFTRAPLPLVASAALSAVSVAVQGLHDMKRADRLTGPCSLFLLTIAESGERKTTADGFFTKPLRDYEAEQAEAAKPAIKAHKSDMAAWEAKKSGLQDAIRNAARKGDPTGNLTARMRDLVNDEPQPPRVPRLLYGDATPEALTWGLSKTWPTAAVISSEAGTVLGSHGMNAESMTRNLSILNQLWDGRDIPIDRRKEGGSFTVRGARLTIALQVQELTLRQFFERTSGLARGIGFLARFLVAWPASTQGTRFFRDAPTQWPALADFNLRMSEILRTALPMTDAGELEPALLGFTPEAFEAWRAFHDAIESGLGIGGELSDVRDVASKTADNAARVALLFHVFEGRAGAVSAESFNGAARIVAWHLSEARRFLGEFALPPEVADAARLDAWLLAYCKQHATPEVPKKKARQYGPLRDGAMLDAALHALVELDRVRVVKDGKRQTIELNPHLAGFATATPATPATQAGDGSKSSNGSSSKEGQS